MFSQLNVAVFLCGILLLRVSYLLLFHPLASYPGPLLAKLTNFWSGRPFPILRLNGIELSLMRDSGDAFPFSKAPSISPTLNCIGDTESSSATARTACLFPISRLSKLSMDLQALLRRVTSTRSPQTGNLMTRMSLRPGRRPSTERQKENCSPLP